MRENTVILPMLGVASGYHSTKFQLMQEKCTYAYKGSRWVKVDNIKGEHQMSLSDSENHK